MAKREEREPLFRLDLGKNGGVLAPYDAQELLAWINREVHFWHWLPNAPSYSHKGGIENALRPLQNAQNSREQSWSPANTERLRFRFR